MCADDEKKKNNNHNNNKRYTTTTKTSSNNNNRKHEKEKKNHQQKKQEKQEKLYKYIKTSTSGRQKSGFKWKIIITTIILLLCRISHVHAIRKGRLMSPSTFTALSGDLHVQIQFSGEDVAGGVGAGREDVDGGVAPGVGEESDIRNGSNGKYDETNAITTTTRTTATRTTRTRKTEKHLTDTQQQQQSNGSSNNSHINNSSNVENIITSTLVISKYIDDYALQEGSAATAGEGKHEVDKGSDSLKSTTTRTIETNNHDQLLQRKRKEIVQNIPLFPDPRNNVTQIAVPCQTFTRGGLYEMQVVTNLKTTTQIHSQNINTTNGHQQQNQQHATPTIITTTLMPVSDERLRQTLDVRWPSADMKVSPVRLRTYPEKPVEVTLRFPEVNCERAWRSENLPEFWLELVYCGKERTCAQLLPHNISKSNILYAEQVRGYPKHMTVKLSCDLFGLAGNYAVQLRPMVPAPNVPITRRFLSVDWSDKFVFNVYARSIFPCDPHKGIGVLYEYPACILEQGDRVRLYAKLRADVKSMKPPTTLHYVSEQRVVKSQYSLYFSCDLFTEKYVEYCFVYVSQAISGAVADVRMDCVPTLPVSESDTGGWGPWSDWTPCSTNCLGGTRNRYRFCDSPAPRYGAKFCEGPSVETQKCGKTVADTWDCIYETSGTNSNKPNRTEVSQEIGPGCRCGCIVHLGSPKPKRIIAGETQSCPGRSFWLIQVDGEQKIVLSLNFLRLPCTAQYIKVRDGPSVSSTLLIELSGGVGGGDAVAGGDDLNMPTQVVSTGAQLLLEFYAGDIAATVEITKVASSSSTIDDATNVVDGGGGSNINSAPCTGGFLASVEQIGAQNTTATTLLAATRLLVKSRAVVQKPKWRTQFTLVHVSAVIFASIIILISAMLGAQYMMRYRKYHLAVARRRDEGSRLHTPRASMSSLQSPPSRAMSTTTLISEVIYLVKMRPKHQLRHSILRESVDAENLARETEFNDDCSVVQVSARMSKCAEELGSHGSIVTIQNEIISPITESLSGSPSMEEEGLTEGVTSSGAAAANGSCSGDGTLTRKDSCKDSESIISSGMSSIYNSPPMNSKRLSKYSERYDAVTLKIRNSRLEDSITDCESSRSGGDYERLSRCGARSASVSLTNGCYSPAASIVSSTATIRTTNAKESKEKQNRKKLLARPGSEFSLGNQEELEMDYYDYNVINAGAAPGSYLGMDPAHLIWIPPFDDIHDARDDDDKTPEPNTHEPDETEPLYEEIKMPKYGHYLSARSNTESSGANTTSNTTPTSDELSPLNSNLQSKASTPTDVNTKNGLIQRIIASTSKKPQHSLTKQLTPFLTRKQRRQAKHQSKSTLSLGNNSRESIPLHELSGTRSARDIIEKLSTPTTNVDAPDTMTGSYVEKETSVVKSPSDLQNFLALDDIQFADESESEHDQVATLKREKKPTNEHEMSTRACYSADEKILKDLKRVSVGIAIAERRCSGGGGKELMIT